MSTTLESFEAVEDNTCPHGEPTDDELACSYCWLEAQSGTMAIDDPRRVD